MEASDETYASYSGHEEKGMCSKLGRIPWLTLLGVVLIAGGFACVMYGYKVSAPGVYESYDKMGFNGTLSDIWCKDCAKFVSDQAEKGDESYYSPSNPTYIIVDSAILFVCVAFLCVIAVIGTGLTREHCCVARPCCQCYWQFVNFTTGLVVLLFLVATIAIGVTMLVPTLGGFYLNSECKDTGKACVQMADFGFNAVNGTELCFGDDGICGRLPEMLKGFTFLSGGLWGASLGFIFALMAIAANFAHFGDMRLLDSEEKYTF